MTPTVKTVYDWIDSVAPFSSAEDYDNTGLLAGRFDWPVTRILAALDCTLPVVEEAIRIGAELILTHHPLLFHSRQNLREDDPEGQVLCALIRGRLSLISAHTNLDRAPGGTSDVLASLFSLKSTQGEEYVRSGLLPSPMTAGELRTLASELLHAPVRLYGSPDAKIDTLAVGAGAYDEGYQEAADLGAQAYLTGEVHHHNAVAATAQSMVLLEGGHYATEAPGFYAFGDCLQSALNRLQYFASVVQFTGLPYQGALEP